MNYYGARQRKSDSRWDFSCKNDNRIWPVGYCSKWRPFSDQEIKEWHISPEKLEEHARFKDKHHDTGHSTEEEACECYRQYLLDCRTHYYDDIKDAPTLERCKVCGDYTSGSAEVDHGERMPLCKIHRTREQLERLYPRISWITSSW